MRGHAQSNSRKLNKHWQSGKKSPLSFVYVLKSVNWHSPETFGYDLVFARDHNEPAFDKTISRIRIKTEGLPVYPNSTATYMGAIGLSTYYTSNNNSFMDFGQYVECLVDIPDITTQSSLKVGNRSESTNVNTSIDFAARAFYGNGGFNATPTSVFSGSWTGTPAGTAYGGVGYGATGRRAIYQRVDNDMDITITLDNPIRITKYSGSLVTNYDFAWHYFIHTTNRTADLNFLNGYVGKTKIIVEMS